jgi:rfaE bifunctional protein nucleotidyltransferase chain/domain
MRPDTRTEILAISNRRKNGSKIVFTNGCFDILHVGHTRYLTDAKSQGDILVVGLNSDNSVKGLKGNGRPVVSELERKEVLLSLKPVDFVCIFDEETPFELIKEIMPDVLVKGGDWPVDKIVGNEIVTKNGGKVYSLPFHPGHSSTALIERIVKL